MSTFLNTASFWDTYQEYNFRQWKNLISAQLAAAGFVRTSDTGQIATNLQSALGYVLCANTGLSLTGWYNAFDQNTGTSWSSGLAPTAGVLPNTIFIVWDNGTGVTNTAATYKIWMAGANGDPAGWTLQGSNDNIAWTTLDTQIGISVTVGYQTYTIVSPAAFRYYRLAITNVRGTTTAMVFTDWQLMTSAPANIISFTPAFTTGTSVVLGYEIWRFNDTLQSTVPCFFKLEYGIGASTTTPNLWITMGSASDGAGNILGLGTTTRTSIFAVSGPASPNTFAPTIKTVASYATNGSRIAMALGTNNAAAIIFVLERLKTNAGADSSNGVTFFSCSANTTMNSIVCPASGPMPVIETTNAIVLAPIQSTGVTGTVTALYEVVPFLGPRQPMMLGALAYFFANLTADTPITVPVYGSNHVYYPIGNNVTGTMRGAGAMSLAILYE